VSKTKQITIEGPCLLAVFLLPCCEMLGSGPLKISSRYVESNFE